MRDADWFRPGSTRSRDVLLLGALAAVLLVVLTPLTGRIAVNHGYGYDGADYVQMVKEGIGTGTPSTRMRPVVVLIATAVDRAFFREPISSFEAINLVFAALLAMVLGELCRRYGASRAATATLIVNLALCIATAKMFAFYPTLVDLGAYFFMAAGAWAIVTGRRALIVVACGLAVLSREFAGTLALFGVLRDVRLRRPLLGTVATYGAVVTVIAWGRWLSASYAPAGEDERVLALGALASSLFQNLALWRDPQYAAFWLYFAATLFGGVSLALLASPRAWVACVTREPEWLAIVLPIAAVTAVGYTDMWRYLAFVLPAVPVLWVWGVSHMPPAPARRLFAGVTVATLLTQRPWQAMDLAAYFRDWFPYFLVVEHRAEAATLWPLWTYRIATALLMAALMAWLVRSGASRAPGEALSCVE